MLLSYVAYLSLVIAAAAAYLGVKKSSGWYWLSGIGIYVFSFISGFTIGYYTVAFCFVLWISAITHSYGMKKRLGWAVSIILGCAIWLIVSYFGLVRWIFSPLFLFLN